MLHFPYFHVILVFSDEEVMGKPKYSMRKFCDICDVFDKHDTDECPMQEGGEDTGGVKNYGDRDHERPYCNICEGNISSLRCSVKTCWV